MKPAYCSHNTGLDPVTVAARLRAQGVVFYAVGVPGDDGCIDTPMESELIGITGRRDNCIFEKNLNNLPKFVIFK